MAFSLKAPFKLTTEFVEVMGGEIMKDLVDSEDISLSINISFLTFFVRGFYILHQNADKLILMVQMIANT